MPLTLLTGGGGTLGPGQKWSRTTEEPTPKPVLLAREVER